MEISTKMANMWQGHCRWVGLGAVRGLSTRPRSGVELTGEGTINSQATSMHANGHKQKDER